MIPLIVASRNPKKVEELQAILTGLPIQVISLRDLARAPEVVEDGVTFEENAVKKAVEIARWSQKLVLADDSGLCVDALGGEPGVYSARFAGEAQDDPKNCEKLLRMMEKIPEAKRGAEFVCVIAIAAPDSKLMGTARGECRGWIAHDLKGSFGFGYDPLFVDPQSGKRFAELLPEVKNKISHRAKALLRAKEILREYADRRGKSHVDKP